MKKAVIFHNNVCSTSRNVLDILKEKQFEIEIRNYIQNPPSVDELKDILQKSGLEATALLRKKDKVFKESFEDKHLSNEEWLQAISENPSILERPIVIIGNKAVLARPIDKVKEIF
jgi:arsenate reductase